MANLVRGKLSGIIGCGVHAFSIIAYHLYRNFGPVIAAGMDPHIERAAALARYYHAPIASDDADVVINHPAVRMVYIASNHASHAKYAIAALEGWEERVHRKTSCSERGTSWLGCAR